MYKPNLSLESFCELSHSILQCANKGFGKVDFIESILKTLSNFCKCDVTELRIKENNDWLHCKADFPQHSFEAVYYASQTSFSKNKYDMLTCFSQTASGSFWSGHVSNPGTFHYENKGIFHEISLSENYRSFAIIPLIENDELWGLLLLKSGEKKFFNHDKVEFYEHLSKMIGTASNYRLTQAALHERIKEMTCLHEMNKIVEIENISLEGIVQKVVEILPPAWQYPEITHAQIVLDGNRYTTKNFCFSEQKLSSEITIRGEKRGCVEVFYMDKELGNFFSRGKVFLTEELHLIRAIAQQLALTIERRETQEEKSKLQEQLRHSDRLATIGQLAAGVAHELNEPLVHILGFAQLTLKIPELPTQARNDINKILKASLHAREIIKKLLLFARQTQTKKTHVDLNEIVKEGMYFLEVRCAKQHIEVVSDFANDLPMITADPSQLHQVIINLIVNSIHAMPEGGVITLKTSASKDKVSLVIEDTGLGMSEDVREKIFLPFYTTKDIGEGTGLGLAVVHGIITTHKGSIEVQSAIKKGTQFAISFPITQTENNKLGNK